MAQISILKLSEIQTKERMDSEYFSKDILKIISKIRKLENGELDELCLIKSGITPQYSNSGNIKVIRSGDLNRNLFIDEENLLQTNEEKLFFINDKDVLISSIGRGSIGKINIYDDKERLAIVSEINILRNFKINPYYLFVFLRTIFGQEQINREITGATGQLHLLKSNVKKILVPIPSKSFQKKIQDMILLAKKHYKKSKELYEEAELFLLKEIGLEDYKPRFQLSFISDYNNIFNAERIDADYFQPKYNKIIEKAREKSKLEELENLVLIKKGIEVGSKEYLEEGIPFVRVSNLSKLGLNKNNQKYISKELYSKLKTKYTPKKDDILLSKDATLGVALLLKENREIINSIGILRLKVKEQIDKNYLTLVLNSQFVKSQIERDSGGSVIIHWKEPQIRKTLIPLISKEKQGKISNLIEESFKLRDESKEILDKTKKEVENYITSK